ncbi:MAG TPA: LLM class flavin-dependent oxidoreductase, partial [Candidatus Handelsmanbacteria bacterium]|nr:LLM class flavin-dependent oxidoreductase [Candidatus Handelsmanbacteria bacterium]
VNTAKDLEARGFDTMWMANIFGIDAITAAAIIGRETEKIKIGSGIILLPQRDPVVLAKELAGIDVISDGEWRRASYIGIIAEMAHGFELGYAPDGRPWTVVTGEVTSKATGVIADEIAFVRGRTNRLIKATLPSPALLAERMWDPERSS